MRHQLLRPIAAVGLATILLGATSHRASAQPFGQNKVQFADLDFEILRTEHFDVYHYRSERAAVEDAARMAERWYTRLSDILELEFERRQPLILYANHPHFEQTHTVGGPIGVGTGGVTEGAKRRVVMPFAAGLGETDHVLGHELVHAFQYALREREAFRLTALPLWFIEGMAEYLSLGAVDAQTAMWIRDAAATESVPTLEELSQRRYFPYRWGHALWAYISGRWGDEVIGDILRAAGGTGDPLGAFEEILGLDHETLSAEWQAAIYAWAGRPDRPERTGQPLITESSGGGSLNVGPALSPDGRQLVFLSERDLFSIDMFVADAATGRVTRKLVETAVDPHFDNLQFLSTAGAWGPEGRRFVFSAVRNGQPVLTVVDAASGERLREIELASLGEAMTPTWAPDGSRIAFSALDDGYTDLFVYDLDADRLTQLTADRFADLHPSWSPSGDTIAFVTDRFTSDEEQLAFGRYRLATIDPATGDVLGLPGFRRGKQINPQWSADGEQLFFVADPDGVSNVYRLSLQTDEIAQITDVASGVSGITASSPTLSVARGTNRIAYTVYRDGRHEIFTLEPPVSPVPRSGVTRARDSLPPVSRPAGLVAQALGDPRRGLPPVQAFPVEDYEVDFDLDYIGQPYVFAGADRFGSVIGGGVSFLFSDMLGEHTLGTVVQFESLNDGLGGLAGQAGYINRTSRWNWGVTAEQVPFLTGTFFEGFQPVSGENALVQEEVEFRQVSRQISGVASYPFDRAHRLEIIGGYRHMNFDQTTESRAFSTTTGALLREDRQTISLGDPLQFAELGISFVKDSSIMGPTGPLMGERYRIDLAPTVGDLTFSTLQADYRRYFVPARPFTVAGRLLHAGRYGADATSSRLAPLFLGYPALLRGYDFQSFSASECGVATDGSCPVLDQMLGTRLLIASLELRFPLLGAMTGNFDYGPLPIDGVVFADAGVAWTADTSLRDRPVYRSVGLGVRAPTFGSTVIELNFTRPLDRPGTGWQFSFLFRPGF